MPVVSAGRKIMMWSTVVRLYAFVPICLRYKCALANSEPGRFAISRVADLPCERLISRRRKYTWSRTPERRLVKSLARILHVDDDESWRQIIKRRLGDHQIDSAESLQQAIGLLQTESPYNVALVDLNLTSDDDRQGGDLLDLMQIRYPSTRRILVTGSPPAGSVRKNLFERYDVDEIIIKRDMDLPDLRRVVEEAVAQALAGPSQSLRFNRSALRQRFKDWQKDQADRLSNELRVAGEHVHEAARATGQSQQRAQLALAAAEQKEGEFKLACARLRRLLEEIEDEDQFDAAQAALTAAEDHFAEQLEGHHTIRTTRESISARSPGGSPSLPEPHPSEVRSSDGKAADYAVGDIFDNRFEILDVLGQGGLSNVYRVLDEVEDEERALKLFYSAVGYQAVRREIAALRKIRHPNVVEVFWAGRTGAGEWYLITEFIDGESLHDFATGKSHLRDREAVDVALDLLAALVAFHPDSVRLEQLDAKRQAGGLSEAESREWTELKDAGLIHRDIKPLNVLLTRSGAKLLDFNIASRVGDPVYTHSGTPPYQAPDAGLDRWDVSTDLFAVGVLLYQLLCNGHHPYPNAMPTAVEPVIDPRTIRPDLGSGLAEFLIKACAPTRADRFSTAAEMQLVLRDIRSYL
jgi:CheY-like chemotaxis protein